MRKNQIKERNCPVQFDRNSELLIEIDRFGKIIKNVSKVLI